MKRIISVENNDSVRIIKINHIFYPQFVRFKISLFGLTFFKLWCFFYTYTPEYSENWYSKLQKVGFYKQSNAFHHVVDHKVQKFYLFLFFSTVNFFLKLIKNIGDFYVEYQSIILNLIFLLSFISFLKYLCSY